MKDEKLLSGFNGKDLSDEMKELTKSMNEMNKSLKEQLKQVNQAFQRQQAKQVNPYQEAIDAERKKREKMSANPNDFIKDYGSRMGLDAWKKNQESLINSNNNLSDEEKIKARASLNTLYNERKIMEDESQWKEWGDKLGDIVSDTLTDVIIDFDNFDQSMKKLSKELLNYFIKEGINWLKGGLVNIAGNGSIGNLINSKKLLGGKSGNIWSAIQGFGHGFGLWHSGGVIPNKSYSLGGTSEQLAILKGGERVLSPGENVQYESENGGGQPVVFNNFNIKAWDSKDVSKYLLENKNLLNAITFEGIKNNNNHLRSLVSNV